MASTKPLTQTAGLVEQLQSVDTLAVGDYDLPNTISDDGKMLITVNSAAVWDYASHADLTNLTVDDHHAQSHTHNGADDSGVVEHDDTANGTIANHDTTATGTELDTLTDGSDADSLHIHPAAVVNGDTDFYLATTGNDSTGNGSLANPWKSVEKAVRQVYEMQWERDAIATINIGDGEYEFRETLIKNHSANILISSLSAVATVAVTNIDSVTSNGSSRYDVRLTTTDTTGLVVGQLACTGQVLGSRSWLSGAWEIITVHDSTDITVHVKTWSVVPTTGVVTFDYHVPKAILIPIDARGFRVESGHVTFEGVSFRYVSGASAETAIELRGCNNVSFTGYVGINGFTSSAVLVNMQSAITLEDTYISNCAVAVTVKAGSFAFGFNSVFSGGSYGFVLEQSSISLLDCDFYGNNVRGVQAIEFSSYRSRGSCNWRDNSMAALVNMGSLGYPLASDNVYAVNGTDLSPIFNTYGNSDSYMRV